MCSVCRGRGCTSSRARGGFPRSRWGATAATGKRRSRQPSTPTTWLDFPRPGGGRDRIAAPEEAAALVAALPTGDRALWATAMYAGLRRGEVRALRWSDVDLSARVIGIDRTWDDEEGELESGKMRAARRTVPIAPQLRRELAANKLVTGRDGRHLVFGATVRAPLEPGTGHVSRRVAGEAA